MIKKSCTSIDCPERTGGECNSEIKHTKNSEKLMDFLDYCSKNPEQRFWQALLNWVKDKDPRVRFILKSGGTYGEWENIKDTFYER